MKMEGASPGRLLEMLSDRFGALEAVAYSSIKLSRYVSRVRDVDGPAGRGGGAGVWERSARGVQGGGERKDEHRCIEC